MCKCCHGDIQYWGNMLSLYMPEKGKSLEKISPIFLVKISRFPHLTYSIESARTQCLTINYEKEVNIP